MAKNIVVRKKVGDKWEELHPATNAGNVALADGKTVEKKMEDIDAFKAEKSKIYNKNFLINADFKIWQRGTMFASPDGKYTADRWIVRKYLDENFTIERVVGINGYEMCIKETKGSSLGATIIDQPIEDHETFKGKICTVSAKVKTVKGLKYSVWIIDDVGNNANSFTGDGSYMELYASRIVPSTINSLIIRVGIEREGAAVGEVASIQNVKFEIGDVATPFISRDYGEELYLCQRYYEKSYGTEYTEGGATEQGQITFTALTSDWLIANFRFLVKKRIPPTMKIYHRLGSIGVHDATSGNIVQTATFDLSRISENGIYAIKTDPVLTPGKVYAGQFVADAEI